MCRTTSAKPVARAHDHELCVNVEDPSLTPPSVGTRSIASVESSFSNGCGDGLDQGRRESRPYLVRARSAASHSSVKIKDSVESVPTWLIWVRRSLTLPGVGGVVNRNRSRARRNRCCAMGNEFDRQGIVPEHRGKASFGEDFVFDAEDLGHDRADFTPDRKGIDPMHGEIAPDQQGIVFDHREIAKKRLARAQHHAGMQGDAFGSGKCARRMMKDFVTSWATKG